MTYYLTGIKVGQLTVLEKCSHKSSSGRTLWKCACLCGNFTELPTYQLSGAKATQSCGRCEWHIKHREAYISWCSMKQRCNDPNVKDYKNYGGRGISYCTEWEKFVNFYLDMGDPPLDYFGERLTLDRKDVNGNYTKENCKWSTRSEQQRNKTTS